MTADTREMVMLGVDYLPERAFERKCEGENHAKWREFPSARADPQVVITLMAGRGWGPAQVDGEHENLNAGFGRITQSTVLKGWLNFNL